MPQSPIGVETFPIPGAWVDNSGTIAAASTSQIAIATNTARKALIIQNPTTTTEALYINFTTVASTGTVGLNGSIALAPGTIYKDTSGFVTGEQINVAAVTVGHPFVAKYK